MDISARTGLDWTIWVTSVRMRREDRSSISTFPLADLGWKQLLPRLCTSLDFRRRQQKLVQSSR
jgi:hypothetical protein